jgi:hypothetical protein
MCCSAEEFARYKTESTRKIPEPSRPFRLRWPLGAIGNDPACHACKGMNPRKSTAGAEADGRVIFLVRKRREKS